MQACRLDYSAIMACSMSCRDVLNNWTREQEKDTLLKGSRSEENGA